MEESKPHSLSQSVHFTTSSSNAYSTTPRFVDVAPEVNLADVSVRVFNKKYIQDARYTPLHTLHVLSRHVAHLQHLFHSTYMTHTNSNMHMHTRTHHALAHTCNYRTCTHAHSELLASVLVDDVRFLYMGKDEAHVRYVAICVVGLCVCGVIGE